MIVEALVIILVILIVSNFAVGVFNKMVPACADKEYFQNVNKLPDDAVVGLGSIPSHVGFDYVGAATVETRIPGVIGLTSRANKKNGYTDNNTNSSGNIEGYVTHMNIAEEDPSDCEISTKASNTIDAILQTNKKQNNESDKAISTKNGTINHFEMRMEGIAARNSHSKSKPRNHRVLAHGTERDGYDS